MAIETHCFGHLLYFMWSMAKVLVCFAIKMSNVCGSTEKGQYVQKKHTNTHIFE